MASITFRAKSASAKVNTIDSNIAFVNNVYSKIKGHGHARELMEHICRWADEREVVLLLSAQSYENEGLNNQQLISFYSSFNFIRQIGDGPLWPARMKREPRKNYNAHNEKETLRRR